MSKFGLIIGASLQETVWFSKACNELAEQIYLIRRTLELALKPVVKGFIRGINPAYQPFSKLSSQFQRHFDPAYRPVT